MLYLIYFRMVQFLFFLSYRIRFSYMGALPEGKAVFCGNHTSMADPFLIALGIRRERKVMPAKFVAKKELSRFWLLKKLLDKVVIFIERGGSDLGAVRASIAEAQRGGKIVIFPEGSRFNAGDAKTGSAMIAVRSGAPVVPVYITKGFKPLFSMKRISVRFGDPYYPEKLSGESTSEAYRRIADEIMDKIMALGKSEE